MNRSIDEQLILLENILKTNKDLMNILTILDEYSKENKSFTNYYVAAGSINQTVFNYLSGYDYYYGIKDYDIVYFDEDLSYEAEDKIIKDITARLSDIAVDFDIKNQARVHLWYNEKYNSDRLPYKNVEDAIASWTSTVTCIGVRLNGTYLRVCCPYGLNDLFSMIIRPVKRNFREVDYMAKAKKWKSKWDKLEIKEW